MQDSIIRGTGNSRYLKSAIGADATWEQFRTLLRTGTLPIDLNGINPAGFQTVGNALSKSNLLKDSTVSQFGLGTDAVPDDVLSWVGKYNEHWWSLLHGLAHIEYEEEKIYHSLASSPAEMLLITNYNWYNGNNPATIQYASEVSVNGSTGEITLKNPVSVSWSRTNDRTTRRNYANVLLGKYILGALEVQNNTSGTSSDARTNIYFIPSDATINVPSDSYTIGFDNFYSVSARAIQVPSGGTTYEHSTDRNAFPDSGTVDGVTYTYLGVPFDKLPRTVRMATGSYAGVGTYGSNNYCKLEFDFAPQLLMVRAHNAGYAQNYSSTATWYSGSSVTSSTAIDYYSHSFIVDTSEFQVTDDFSSAVAYTKYIMGAAIQGSNGNGYIYFKKSTDGKKIAWKADNIQKQFNLSGCTYHYVAFG